MGLGAVDNYPESVPNRSRDALDQIDQNEGVPGPSRDTSGRSGHCRMTPVKPRVYRPGTLRTSTVSTPSVRGVPSQSLSIERDGRPGAGT